MAGTHQRMRDKGDTSKFVRTQQVAAMCVTEDVQLLSIVGYTIRRKKHFDLELENLSQMKKKILSLKVLSEVRKNIF